MMIMRYLSCSSNVEVSPLSNLKMSGSSSVMMMETGHGMGDDEPARAAQG